MKSKLVPKPVSTPEDTLQPQPHPMLSEEAIRLRAYGIFEARGVGGNELADWLEAERELSAPPAVEAS